MRREKLILCSMVVLFALTGKAQVPSVMPWNGVVPAIANAGGSSYDNALSYYRYEWSFGELLLIQAFASPDSSIRVTQGVLQPCTDKIGASPYTVLFEAGDYKLFPNPTSGKFELNFFMQTPGHMSLQLINAAGQLLEKRSYHYDGCCRIELFDLSGYPSGVYLLVADLEPDNVRADGLKITRHGGMKIIKL
ncbi:MAG: hypothetical protein ACT4OJ_10115 [Bacteroidota bacterium]